MSDINYFSVHSDTLADFMVSLGDACPKIEWNKQVVRAIPGGAKQGSDNSPGGFSLTSDMSLLALVEDFGSGPFPESTENVIYPVGGDGYRILTVTRMAGGRILRLHLESSAQGL